MKTQLLLLMLTMFTVISCSQESSQDDDISTYIPENYSSLKEELKKTDFSCESTINCPDNVGLVYINSNGNEYSPQVGRCTGFLVKENIVGTNSHCVPKHLKNGSRSCTGQLAIRFMNSGKKNVFDCEELLDHSPLGVYEPDYSFFRIEPTGIKPLKVSQNGIKDNQNILVARVTPSQYSLGGTLSVDSCRIALGSLLNLQATNSWAKTGLAVDCEAIPGNSGSPVLNNNGEVIGILQSKMKDQFLVNLEHSFKQFGLNLPDQVKPHFIFTNLSCIESEGILEKMDKCEQGQKLAFTDCLELDTEENEKRASRVVDVWKRELPDIFVYNFIANIADGGSISADPLCVKTKEQTSSYSTYVKRKGIIGFRKDNIELKYPKIIKLGARFETDHDLRLRPTMDFREDFRSEYEVKIEQSSQKWNGTINSTYNDSRFNLSSIKIPTNISSCTKQQIESGDQSFVKMKDKTLLTEAEYLELEEKKKKNQIMCEK
jgi:hypothetical protein